MEARRRSQRRDEAKARARLAARHDLVASGLHPEDAAIWCAAWEAEAERQGLRPDGLYFWDAARGWIDAQRSFDELPAPRVRQAGKRPRGPELHAATASG